MTLLSVRFSNIRFAISARQNAITLLLGYFAQMYGAVVAILFAPYVLATIGAEAYGLVGLFLILQAWFQLLDAGLTPAVTRETARFTGGAVSQLSLAKTLKGLESVVVFSSIPILAIAWMVSNRVAGNWLQPDTLTTAEIVTAFQLMSLIVLIRWVSGVRRGLLIGFERHATIYAVNLAVATLRYPCIVVYFLFVSPSSTHYFLYQLGISCLEALLLFLLCRKLFPDASQVKRVDAIKALRSIARFALNHAFLALLWLLIVQTDKLLLSRFLTLSDFGYFTLAAAAAYGVNLMLMPIGQYLMPKLSRLKAHNDEAGMISTYRRLTRFAVVSISGITVLFMCYPYQVLMVWTMDSTIANIGKPVLAWYSLGNAAMAISAFTYYLQYAQGYLRLHTVGTAMFLIAIVPALYLGVTYQGLQGAAITWAALWVLYLCSWVTFTHMKLLNGLHWYWLADDVLKIFTPVLLVALFCKYFIVLPEGRLFLAMVLALYWVLFSVIGIAFSRLVSVSSVVGFFRQALSTGIR